MRDSPEKNVAYDKEYYDTHRAEKIAYAKMWARANPGRAMENYRSSHYGVGVEEFDFMFDAQDGRCAICDKIMDPPYLDHDHDTGWPRGLLCRHCNTGIGMLMDSDKLARAAADYLCPPTEGFKKFLALYPTSSLSMMK